jgi:hypothetical protein
MRHKRRSPRRRSRRRRVGGIMNQSKVMKALGAIAGVIATGVINDQVAKMKNADGTPKVDPKILAVAEVVLGFMLPNFVKGDIVEGIGYGMIGAGGVNAAKGFGLITGVPIIAGYNDMQIVGKVGNLPPQVQKFVQAAPKMDNRPTPSQVITGVMGSWYNGNN